MISSIFAFSATHCFLNIVFIAFGCFSCFWANLVVAALLGMRLKGWNLCCDMKTSKTKIFVKSRFNTTHSRRKQTIIWTLVQIQTIHNKDNLRILNATSNHVIRCSCRTKENLRQQLKYNTSSFHRIEPWKMHIPNVCATTNYHDMKLCSDSNNPYQKQIQNLTCNIYTVIRMKHENEHSKCLHGKNNVEALRLPV